MVESAERRRKVEILTGRQSVERAKLKPQFVGATAAFNKTSHGKFGSVARDKRERLDKMESGRLTGGLTQAAIARRSTSRASIDSSLRNKRINSRNKALNLNSVNSAVKSSQNSTPHYRRGPMGNDMGPTNIEIFTSKM